MEASWLPLAELSSALQKKRKQKNTMDLVDVCAATSTTDRKCVSERKRPRHRKTAAPPPTMQNEDQRGPKTGAERRASRTTPREAQPSDNGRTLRFTCCQCEDSTEHMSTDLVRHVAEKHRESAPVFSCHTCPFTTHQFSYLQVHLWSHTDTFSSCSICNDNVTRSWSEFSSHLTMHHCRDGQYSCDACPEFSTGDIGLFLDHLCVHVLGPKRANEMTQSVRSLHRTDQNQCGSITTTQTLRCRHCGYEASHRWLLAKHMDAKHMDADNVSQVANRKKNSKAIKPTDPIAKIKPRLTRSAVREMCWLTQDCLSLPGRQFLDRYCHLPDPQTTLDQTQHFLMKSVAGETGNQKWTNALKNVLSNAPQDMNLNPKPEHGTSNPSDLTVLTVKNRIIVTQNGAAYAKRLKMRASAGKEAPPPESAPGDSCGTNGAQSNGNETDSKLNPHASVSAQVRPPQHENRENQELTTDHEERAQTTSLHENAGQLKTANESHEQTFYNAQLKHRRRNRRRRKRRRPRRAQGPSALALKLVLKKSPTKGKQWVSESPLSPSGAGGLDDHRSTSLHAAPSPDGDERKWADGFGPSVATTTSAPSLCAGEQTGDRRVAGEEPGEGGQDSRSAQTSSENQRCSSSSPLDGATPQSQAAFIPESETNSGDSAPTLTSEQSDRMVTLPADPCPDPGGEAPQQGPSPAALRRWQPAPKNLVRTLKLVAINPCQPVRRPVRHQPVVVLNHPDADVPEVARVMEVVNRYRGEVQKVVLSRRTLQALSSTSGEFPAAPADHGWRCAESSVQERFILKLKLRKLSGKKYEVVGAPAPSGDVETKFRCWFCGRVFVSQETWRIHRRRHLMEWNGPKCEHS